MWYLSTLQNRTVYDQQLDLDDADQASAEEEHLPYGVPGYFNHSTSLLYQTDYITGYSSDLQLPLWTAFTLRRDQVAHRQTNPLIKYH